MLDLTVAFLGGVGEFGKNMTLYACGDSAIIVDAGAMFPDEGAWGVDKILPDWAHVHEEGDRLKAIILTHGHEDHIGAVAALTQQFDVPIYGTPFTLALVKRRLDEEEDPLTPDFHLLESGKKVQLGDIQVEGIPVTHSIPQAMALAISTPQGTVVHTGDFRFDQSPLDGKLSDYRRFQELGEEGVLALLCDSTNSLVRGLTPSEVVVRDGLEPIISKATGRIYISHFSSNVQRMQLILDLAHKANRKVTLVGRSIVSVATVAQRVGLLKPPPNIFLDVEKLKDLQRESTLVITSGSQGEPMSALNRVVFGDNRKLTIEEKDTVIFSARIIPGSERRVGRVVNEIYRQGASAITPKDAEIHVSGHASQEDIKLMAAWVKPHYYVPIHGEMQQLFGNRNIAVQMGWDREDILMGDVGRRIRFRDGKFVGWEDVESGSILIDGTSDEPVKRRVVRDRRHLGTDGVVVPVVAIDCHHGTIVGEVQIMHKGYPLLDEGKSRQKLAFRVFEALEELPEMERRSPESVRVCVSGSTKRYIRREYGKIPLILPVVLEI